GVGLGAGFGFADVGMTAPGVFERCPRCVLARSPSRRASPGSPVIGGRAGKTRNSARCGHSPKLAFSPPAGATIPIIWNANRAFRSLQVHYPGQREALSRSNTLNPVRNATRPVVDELGVVEGEHAADHALAIGAVVRNTRDRTEPTGASRRTRK